MPLEPELTEAKQAEAARQFTAFLAALSPAWDFDFRLCKRRSNNPSVKQSSRSVAPE